MFRQHPSSAMEFARKKTLPQNVALIQSNVIITPEVLRTLKQNGVITAEEATTIEVHIFSIIVAGEE